VCQHISSISASASNAHAKHIACKYPWSSILCKHLATGLSDAVLVNTLRRLVSLQLSGDITFNGKKFNEFQAVHTAAYVDQNDLHQAELTVRETLDFAARCQGIGHKARK